jgi:hypothetical protein
LLVRKTSFFLIWALFGIAVAVGPESRAYNLFGPFSGGGDEYYLKWGEGRAGAHGGTVTWSIMTDGTTISPSFPDPFRQLTGASSLTPILNEIDHDDPLTIIQRCFDRWSAAANIYFVQVLDYGAPFAGSSATPPTSGHIRLGAFAHAAPIGGIGYAPPPNGGSLAGDILLNTNSSFHVAPGGEGDPVGAEYDFEGLIMHEIGHAIGLQHSDVASIMSVDPLSTQSINRELDADDIAGVQFLYGPPLAADFNRDNVADDADLDIWRAGFTAATASLGGDADRDGDVDGDDFLIWQFEVGPSAAGVTMLGASMPEPAGWLLVTTAIAAFSTRARRALPARRR